jgi:DNA-binding NtrC family response regulator
MAIFFPKKEIHILVVDDDQVLADMVVEYLSSRGFSANPAYSGIEALEKFRQGAFEIVITDLMMPDMDGMDLLEAVRKIDSQVEVLVITGYGTISSAVQAIKNGAYDFIAKPFKMEDLEVVINRALERHTLIKQVATFRGLTVALIISVPLWLILGIVLALVWK